MKGERGGNRGVSRREQRMTPPLQDSYRTNEKRADSVMCPECGATFHNGRWTWGKAPAQAIRERCPACRRIHDDFPGGYVTLRGKFFSEHRTEILELVRGREARAREEHPMQRIMHIDDVSGGVLVTTTDANLARHIAKGVHEAYKGDLELTYSKDEDLLRAVWKR